MAVVSLPCKPSASKLRRCRAVKTRQKLYDMAYSSDFLQQVHCQLAMLTSTVNHFVLTLSQSDVDTSMFSVPCRVLSAADGCAYFQNASEASPSPADYCNTEEGLEGAVRQREAPSAVPADSQMECAQQVSEPLRHLVDDAKWQVSRPSIINYHFDANN